MSFKLGDRVIVNFTSPFNYKSSFINKKGIIVNIYNLEPSFCVMFEEEIGHSNYEGFRSNNYSLIKNFDFKQGDYYYWINNENNLKKISQRLELFDD
jgi:hypothetical protein